jgi:hypothetical protein
MKINQNLKTFQVNRNLLDVLFLLNREKLKLTSNYQVCAIVYNKISQCGIKGDRYFVDEVETQYEKNHSEVAKPRISTIQKTRLDTR